MNIQIDSDIKDILLAEYQACQEDINSNGSTYWTMASIFFGVISALVIGLLASGNLSEEYTKHIVGLMAVVMVIIITGLRLILKRMILVQEINYERMRDIELQLGMWKSLRVHGVDNWDIKSCDFDNKIEIEVKNRLIQYKQKEWWCKWKGKDKFTKPSQSFVELLITPMMFLWLYILLTAFAPPIIWLRIVISVVVGAIVIFVSNRIRVS